MLQRDLSCGASLSTTANCRKWRQFDGALCTIVSKACSTRTTTDAATRGGGPTIGSCDGGSVDVQRWDGGVFVVPPEWCDVRGKRFGCYLALRDQLRKPGRGELDLLPLAL